MNKVEKIDEKNDYAAVRFNAVKHGILSRETILPHESREDYESLLNELREEYAPNGPTENALA